MRFAKIGVVSGNACRITATVHTVTEIQSGNGPRVQIRLKQKTTATTTPERAMSIWSDGHVCRYATNNTQSLIYKYSLIRNSYIPLLVLAHL